MVDYVTIEKGAMLRTVRCLELWVWLTTVALYPTAASAWGYAGHRVVGAISAVIAKRRQLAKGGARLAELLNAIWP